MNLSQAYLDRVIARLSQAAEVSYRRIFNGIGIYYRGVQFALVINDRLYFRADENSRALYLQKGMTAFQPRIAVKVESCFFQLPEEVLGNSTELKHWLRIAVEAAQAGDFCDDETTLDTPIRHLRHPLPARAY
ncbi:MAG TPA: TfoX/Sxy family protein [Cellvibrio sp.]|nr:TfoX/Sxy family protein [Cellvibrio sp.]